MPEGPELFKAAQLINKCCRGRIFSGKITKSEVSTKNPDIEVGYSKYEIEAKARGKELMVILTDATHNENKGNGIVKMEDGVKEEERARLGITFQFGMSGCFRFTTVEGLHKHSHLMFHSGPPDNMVLSYVDVRRFGRWLVSDEFSDGRGPDPVFEYQDFRKNVLENIDKSIFKKPICEVLHNQKYFNGIGNYLRAEILYRAKIRPFERASDVLKGLDINKDEPKRKTKGNEEADDILEWCTLVPYEVMVLEGGGYDPNDQNSDYGLFEKWLRCYYNKEMKNLIDSDKRTIWFQGDAGPLAPKGEKAKSRHVAKKELDDSPSKKVKEETKKAPKKGKQTEKKTQNDSKKAKQEKKAIKTEIKTDKPKNSGKGRKRKLDQENVGNIETDKPKTSSRGRKRKLENQAIVAGKEADKPKNSKKDGKRKSNQANVDSSAKSKQKVNKNDPVSAGSRRSSRLNK